MPRTAAIPLHRAPWTMRWKWSIKVEIRGDRREILWVATGYMYPPCSRAREKSARIVMGVFFIGDARRGVTRSATCYRLPMKRIQSLAAAFTRALMKKSGILSYYFRQTRNPCTFRRFQPCFSGDISYKWHQSRWTKMTFGCCWAF